MTKTESTETMKLPSGVKPLEELTLMDDYMFGAVMRDKENLKPLLDSILNIRVVDIMFIEPQKSEKEGYLSHGIRMDLYVEDDSGRIFNVEIQTSDKRNLPKRMRYYQSVIDVDILSPGMDYIDLKKSYVIFICNYDPYHQNRYIYTFENRCLEDTKLVFGDETQKVIVNTQGTVGEIHKDLKELLLYMNKGEATGNYTRQLDKAVNLVKSSEERRHEYMVMKIHEMETRAEGRAEGRVEGRAEGIRDKTIEDARAMYDDGLEPERIARILKLEISEVEVILGLRKMA